MRKCPVVVLNYNIENNSKVDTKKEVIRHRI